MIDKAVLDEIDRVLILIDLRKTNALFGGELDGRYAECNSQHLNPGEGGVCNYCYRGINIPSDETGEDVTSREFRDRIRGLEGLKVEYARAERILTGRVQSQPTSS